MSTHTTNYFNTLITVAEDTKAIKGIIPPEKENKKTIANYQFEILQKQPFQKTSDELLFEIFAIRNDIPTFEVEEARKVFFSKAQACLRTSPLAKNYGWGLYFNHEGKIQLIDCASPEYENLIHNAEVKKIPAMKSKR